MNSCWPRGVIREGGGDTEPLRYRQWASSWTNLPSAGSEIGSGARIKAVAAGTEMPMLLANTKTWHPKNQSSHCLSPTARFIPMRSHFSSIACPKLPAMNNMRFNNMMLTAYLWHWNMSLVIKHYISVSTYCCVSLLRFCLAPIGWLELDSATDRRRGCCFQSRWHVRRSTSCQAVSATANERPQDRLHCR